MILGHFFVQLIYLLEEKKFIAKLNACRDGPVESKETRQGQKHKNTTLLQQRGGKER